MNDTPAHISPILIGAALLGAGIALRQVQPKALSLPERPDRAYTDRGLQRVARKSRDAVATFLPSNMTGSIGRSLAIMGAGLVMVRLLDMAVDDTDQLF